jgi:hypothetical protein
MLQGHGRALLPYNRQHSVVSFAALLVLSCLHSPGLYCSCCNGVWLCCDLEACNLVPATFIYIQFPIRPLPDEHLQCGTVKKFVFSRYTSMAVSGNEAYFRSVLKHDDGVISCWPDCKLGFPSCSSNYFHQLGCITLDTCLCFFAKYCLLCI